jgi:hypothetical protein
MLQTRLSRLYPLHAETAAAVVADHHDPFHMQNLPFWFVFREI